MRPGRNSDRVLWVVLDLLLEPRTEPWLVGELVEEVGSPAAVAEALEALQAAGLIEHSGEAVALTRQ
jgi:predicted transcriptional regulator